MTKSRYAERDTVGTIYSKAQKEGEKHVEVGDLSRELMSSLIEDLNDTIGSNPHQNRPYFITVHESRDLQMKNCFKRRILTTLYRPWPEDDTVVFWHDPISCTTLFCWCLPHWSEFDNILMNESLHDPDQVRAIRAWKSFDMYHFGFCKSAMGEWIPNENYKDKKLEKGKPALILV
jgi:hypothetical protein